VSLTCVPIAWASPVSAPPLCCLLPSILLCWNL
jgi:hypothetical protein